ncbi:MAG: cyclic nucleotide-binding domain-containing protein [Chloroflexi bacterium]|nr:cyclic nucleotide-binding domain-containing protein [Chloroflexota bacterium]
MTTIAEELKEETFEASAPIFSQGSQADRFFIIYQGNVRITQTRHNEQMELASLVGGDYFGEEALYVSRKRSATITASETTFIFSLTREEFNKLIKRFPRMKAAFEVSIASRRLARQIQFKWLRKDEVIYFLARKHPILLFDALALPLALTFFAFLFLAWAIHVHSWVAIAISSIITLYLIGWAIWRAIDWGNDYYIVTNQRVVWLEKVVMLYDSRMEAPLSTILSVGVETDFTGRMMDYGNVVVRTFVGKIPFHHVSHPNQAADMVEELWGRSKHVASAHEKEAMRNEIRRKLGLTEEAKTTGSESEQDVVVRSMYKPGILKILASKLFRDSMLLKVRFESAGTITYRKHIFVLVEHAGLPALFCLLLAIGMFWRFFIWVQAGTLHVDYIFFFLLLLFFYGLYQLGYQYVDWRNDIYQVTDDQIIDIEKKPFGTEERKAAPLENILATESKRWGIIGHIFNYGTVYITVGGSRLEFEDVYNPAAVQQDIDDRRLARRARQEEARAKAERERMADWLASYHENIQEIDNELRQPKNETKNE